MMKSNGKPWFMISIRVYTGRPEITEKYVAFHGRKAAFKDAAMWLLQYWREIRGAR